MGDAVRGMSRPFPIERTLLVSRPNGGYPRQYLLSKETNEEHIEELHTTTQYIGGEECRPEDDGGGEVQQVTGVETERHKKLRIAGKAR